MSDTLVTLITPTGFRRDCFSLCVRWMKNQTYTGLIEWIIVCDDPDDAGNYIPQDLPLNWDVKVIQGPVAWKPGYNTQRMNLDAALRCGIKGDYIFIIEDDDFERPEFLEENVKLLQTKDIVGERNSKYYHIGLPGYREMGNQLHSSLFQTCFRSELMPLFHQAVHSGEKYIDIKFWELARAKVGVKSYLHEMNLSIGIKGMPGRAGIGTGHKVQGFMRENRVDKLYEWVPNDAKYYIPFMKTDRGEAYELLPKQSKKPDIKPRLHTPKREVPTTDRVSEGSIQAPGKIAPGNSITQQGDKPSANLPGTVRDVGYKGSVFGR